MTISVLIADDDALVRTGISMILSSQPDLRIVGEASSGDEAVELAGRTRPDVVLMDVRMPGSGGITATRALCGSRSRREGGRVLVLTSFHDDDAVHDALRAGASGYLLKHTAPQHLVAAIRKVADGEGWLDPAVAGAVIQALGEGRPRDRCPPDPVRQLTPRELEILTLMAHGLSNAEIRQRLVLSESTVKTHVARIVTKTASRDRTQAVVLAYRSGLVKPWSEAAPGRDDDGRPGPGLAP